MKKKIIKQTDYFKSLSKYIKSLNEIIKNGSKKEKKIAEEQREKLLEPADSIKDIIRVKAVKKKCPMKYAYISKKTNDIKEHDICVIYKLKSIKEDIYKK